MLVWFFWQPLLLIVLAIFTFIGGLFAWHRIKCGPKPDRSNRD